MTDQHGYIALMNTMCDMDQFVVVVPVPDKTSASLASYLMQHVLLKFGMCHLVVIDDGTPFMENVVAMCQALNLNYDVLAKGNHEGLSVEHFHRFLNKSVTIAAEERGTNDIFIPASISAAYAWNSASIDGTDIIRSVPAIGQALNFPLDINLNTVSKLIQNNAQATLNYLNFINFYRHFASSILKILTEDCQTAHAKRINNSKNLILLKAGDIVMARTSIQSDQSKNKVAKLSYSVRGPFQIIRKTGLDSYFVRKLDKPDSPELKFMAHDIYPLPPSLKPYEPVDSTDTRYLNQTHAPLVNPLKKSLHINLYNEIFFNKPVPTTDFSFIYEHEYKI